MTIWFTSDLHFDHANIIEYTGRPWGSVSEMNEAIIQNFNSVVRNNDEVHILGDVCMGKIADSLPLVGRLNGKKSLKLGNHDRPFPANKKSSEWFTKYDPYFEHIGIRDGLNINVDGVDIHLEISHFPYEGDSGDTDRFQRFRPERSEDIDWLIHGHVHSPEISIGPNMIHVGIDADWQQYGVERYHPIPITAINSFIKDNK